MMKKTYLTPSVSINHIETQSLLTDSNSIWSENPGIGYGGTDTGGVLDPHSRWLNHLWNEEEENF